MCNIIVFRLENKVYIDKLTIEVTHDTGSESVSPENSGNFDPDTLERNLDKKLTPGIYRSRIQN